MSTNTETVTTGAPAEAPDFGAEILEAASALGAVRDSWRRPERGAVDRFPSRPAIARAARLTCKSPT